MKDITRIHIAKTTYNIEPEAKKDLQEYLASLEAHIDDKEVINDIEIRITELLAEHGVQADGVVTVVDIHKIRLQLGDPKDFMDDSVIDDTADVETMAKTGRKLYRNLDTSLLGGVLGGVANYLAVNPLWIRLAFVVLSLFSFGFIIFLYALLWLLLPPARTAAERLQMQGLPVTVSSIRELNRLHPAKNHKRRSAVIKRVITVTLGILSILAAVSTVVVAVSVWIASTYTIEGETRTYLNLDGYSTSHLLPVVLLYTSGLFLAILFALSAYAFFTQKYSRRIWLSGIVIIALGIASVATAYGVAFYQKNQFDNELQQNTVQTSVNVPVGFESISSMNVNVPRYVKFLYVADNPNGSITLSAAKGQQLDVSVENNVLSVNGPNGYLGTLPGMTLITIHGPKLRSITAASGDITYLTDTQSSLVVNAQNGSVVRTAESSIASLEATLVSSASLVADQSSVESASLIFSQNTSAFLGNISQLRITAPEA